MQDYKKALVTGGAGFIGSHLAEKLLDLGMEVAVIDDLSMGKPEYVPRGAAFYQGSILDPRLLKDALKGVDIVFHNAARVSIRGSYDNFYSDAETNVMGTVSLLKEAGLSGAAKFIYASSMAVYGREASTPLKEDYALKPLSPYGTGKLAGEIYGMQMAEYYGFDFVALRYFNTFGTRQTFTPYVGVITIFTTNLLQGRPPVIYGTGEQVRDFVHVDDIILANMLAMHRPIKNAVINVGTGTGTRVIDIADMLANRIRPGLKPVFAEAQKGEPSDSVADITNLKSLLGFEPRTTIHERIDEIIEWNRHSLQRA